MTNCDAMTRRRMIGSGAAAAFGFGLSRTGSAASAPASAVAIGRCRTYGPAFEDTLRKVLDQIGGIGPAVKGKTVALKLNLTGNPERFPIRPDLPFRNDPFTVLATVRLLARAGARRVRIIESFFPAGQDMALWARYGLDIAAINAVGCKVEWENTLTLGQGKKYARVKPPNGGYIFPAYDLNHSFVDCDSYVSLSKLKNHWIAGVTMSLKNNFGNTPCSLYGGDCGPNGNENPTKERGPVCHMGAAAPPRGVPQELNPDSPRDPGYRVPRITVDLVATRPVDLAIVDGVDSIRGGEGEWNAGVQIIRPGIVIAGRNPVCVDAVSTAVMGYDPRATRGTKPFLRGDNTMLLAEAAGIGTCDLARIEVAGMRIKDALHDYGPGPIGTRI